MNPRQAITLADPAKDLPLQLGVRDEELLRQILATPLNDAAAPTRRRLARERRQVLVTAIVAVAVVVGAVIAIRAVPSGHTAPSVAASPTASIDAALEDAVFAKVSEVAGSDVDVRALPALTWTQRSRSTEGGGFDTTGKTLYLAAACEGGGSFVIRVSGQPDRTVRCGSFTAIGPIDLSAEVAKSPGGSASLDVLTTSGHPRYIVKSVAIPTP